jgi:hypothetical protein
VEKQPVELLILEDFPLDSTLQMLLKHVKGTYVITDNVVEVVPAKDEKQ